MKQKRKLQKHKITRIKNKIKLTQEREFTIKEKEEAPVRYIFYYFTENILTTAYLTEKRRPIPGFSPSDRLTREPKDHYLTSFDFPRNLLARKI